MKSILMKFVQEKKSYNSVTIINKTKKALLLITICSIGITGCQKNDILVEEVPSSKIELTTESQAITSSNKSVNPPNVYDTEEEAWQRVRQLKKERGPGVCALIVVTNLYYDSLTLIGKHAFRGNFYNAPPITIPSGKSAAILGQKTRGTATGFIGYLTYNLPFNNLQGETYYKYFTIGAKAPFTGQRKITGEWSPYFGGPDSYWPIQESSINKTSFSKIGQFGKIEGKIITDKLSPEIHYIIRGNHAL